MSELKDYRLDPAEYLAGLVEFGRELDWDRVYERVPGASEIPASQLMPLLLERIDDQDSNIRDVIMTAWSYLDPKTPEEKKEHFKTAKRVMENDDHRFAALWSAVTVCRYVNDSEYGREARQALASFKQRITQMDEQEGGNQWQEAKKYIIETRLEARQREIKATIPLGEYL